jgi:predicted nucleic acid-binding protein
MTRAAAADAVDGFVSAYRIAEDGQQTMARLLELVRTVPMGGKQVHDASIAATMLAYGIPRLLTFNVADFQRFGSLIEIVVP